MARKDALLALHKLLVVRRDALRRALAGDMSLLKEMGTSGSGDSADIAMDLTQNEVSSSWLKSKAENWVVLKEPLRS